jgi:hypothetical protein
MAVELGYSLGVSIVVMYVSIGEFREMFVW